MHDPFMGLDAEKIDRDVNNAFKNLNKALRFFEKAGLDGCLQIAKTIRAQVRHHVRLRPKVSNKECLTFLN